MIKIISAILTIGIIAGFGMAIMPLAASAVNVFDGCDPAATGASASICAEAQDGTKINTFVGTIVNTLLYIIGAVAVIVIILGGISYVTSTGDPAAITKAKSSITYAVIGLVIAILAYAIVNYVVGIFSDSSTTTTNTNTTTTPGGTTSPTGGGRGTTPSTGTGTGATGGTGSTRTPTGAETDTGTEAESGTNPPPTR